MTNRTSPMFFILLAVMLLVAPVLLSLFPNSANAQNLKTMEDAYTYDIQQVYMTGAQTSTNSVTGLGLSWAILVIGGDATYTVQHTTKTYSPVLGAISPAIDSSNVMTAPAGFPAGARFGVLTKDPKIVVHSLSAGATVHLWIDFLKRIGQ